MELFYSGTNMKPNTCNFCGKDIRDGLLFCNSTCRSNDKKGTWVKRKGVTVLVVDRKK